MRKQKLAIVTFLVAMLSISCILFAVACSKTEKFTITWDVDEHAIVELEGYETLPETLELKKDTEISFTVSADEHYEIASISSAAKLQDDGSYKYTVTKEDTIKVTSRAKLESVSVTKNPTKLSYYAGEELDTTGMEVTAKYETGTTKVVTDYTVNYTEGSAFSIGDKSFTVTYSTDTSTPKTSEAVNLDLDYTATAVEALVQIKPVGGIIDEEIVNGWQARSDFHNWDVDEENMISFTFSELASDIDLPDTTQILVGDGTKWSLKGWVDANGTSYTKILKSTVVSVDLSADWNAVLVSFKKLELKLEGGKPILALTLELSTDFDAYLFFKEGNQNMELKGDEISGKAGETKTVNFDLTKLAEAEEVGQGAWMDIRVNTTLNGVDITQTFDVDYKDYENSIVDVGQMICDGENCYTFITYRNSSNKDELKVTYRAYTTTYSTEVVEESGKAMLVVNGKVNTQLENFAEGATIDLSFNNEAKTATVAADGAWSIKWDITDLKTGNYTFGNISCKAGDNTLFSSELYMILCETTYGEYNSNGSSTYNNWYVNNTEVGDSNYQVSINWTAPMITVNDHQAEYTVTAGVNEDGDATVTYSGVAKKYAGATVKIDYWVASTIAKETTIAEDGTWSITFDLTVENGFVYNTTCWTHFQIVDTEGKVLVKEGNDGNMLFTNWTDRDEKMTEIDSLYSVSSIADKTALAIYNKDKTALYYVGRNSNGGCVIHGIDTTAKVISATSIDLEVDNDKVYYVVNFKSNCTLDEAKEVVDFIDFQGGAATSDTIVYDGDKMNFTAGADNTITLKVDITDLAVDCHWCHLSVNGNKADLARDWADVAPVTVGNKTYQHTTYNFGWGSTKVLVITAADEEEAE